jgi:hypothetical protein
MVWGRSMNSVSIQYFIARSGPLDQRTQCACFSKLIGLAGKFLVRPPLEPLPRLEPNIQE